jgi:hypothetical protein
MSIRDPLNEVNFLTSLMTFSFSRRALLHAFISSLSLMRALGSVHHILLDLFTFSIKVNLSLCLTKHHTIKTYWESTRVYLKVSGSSR